MKFHKVDYKFFLESYDKMLRTYITANVDAPLREYMFGKLLENHISKKYGYVNQHNSEECIKEIYDNLKLPTRATRGSAGYDFFAPIDLTVEPGEIVSIPTGIKWEDHTEKYDFAYVLSIYPRSSLGRDYSLREPNIVSIIDPDYYGNETNDGNIFINLKNEGHKTCNIVKGRAYAQGIITRYYLVDDDHTTETRTGGFGSTNR